MRAALLVVAPLVVVAAACGGDDGGDEAATTTRDRGAEPTGATVTIATFSFEPDPLEVAPGTTITFVNEDAIDHTVTAGTRAAPTPELFDGELPQQGATYELVLSAPGTYEYFCRIHQGPGMTATITVTGDATEAALADAARTATGPDAALFGDLFEDHHAAGHS